MTKREKYISYIINILLASFAGLSLIYALTTSLHFKYSFIQVLGIVFAFLLVYSLLFINRLATRISLISFAVIAGGAFTVLSLKGLLTHYTKKVLTFLFWTYNYTQGYEKLNTKYALYIFLLLCIFISLFLYCFAVKRFNFLVILPVGMALFVSQWMLGYFVSYIAFYLFLLIIMVYYLMHIFLKTSKDKTFEHTSIAGITILSIPICAIIILSVHSFFPIPGKPIQWAWMDKKIASVYNYFSNNFGFSGNNTYFSISSSGFGNKNLLGGTVKSDRTPVLRVESHGQVYLKANSKDFYTGNSWINTSADKPKLSLKNSENKISFDFAEMTNNFYLIAALATHKDYFYNNTIRVTYQSGIKTKSVFVANKTSKISFNKPIKTSVDSNGALISEEPLGNNFNYTLETLSPNYDNANFINMLRKCGRKYYYNNKYSAVLRNYKEETGEDFLIPNDDGRTYKFLPSDIEPYDSDLKTTFEYLNDNNTRYLQLPSKLPSRIGDLARKITASTSNDYDSVKEIEKYLSKNYPYTLSTKPVPRDRDFVDFFLFDSKEGYCVYYATAMTILVRSIGIPARYVEGYILPSKPVSGNIYQVTNEQAHAWVEVYFEGFGWLPFEPTSPFSSAFYSDRNPQAVSAGNLGNNPAADYMKRMKASQESSEADTSKESNENTSSEKSYTGALIILFSLITIIFLSGIILLFNLIKSRISLSKLKTLPPKESILSFYSYYIKLLSLTGIKFNAGETPLEFANRINGIVSGKQNNFKEITMAFIKARYTGEAITDDDNSLMINFYDKIILWLKTDMGGKKFFLYKYILGRI